MSRAGLLTKIVTNLSNEITSRGLTAYFLHDDKGGGTKNIVVSNVNAQQAIANGLRTNGVTVGDITDALTQTFDNRGILIVSEDPRDKKLPLPTQYSNFVFDDFA